MAYGKSSVNIVFACLVLFLVLTAAASFYSNMQRPGMQPASADRSSTDQMPENHPNIDVTRQIAELNRLIAGDPQNPEYRAQIGNLYFDMGQYETAAEHYRQSMALRPGNPNVETDLAVCMHYLGQDDKALEILENVLSYSPGFAQAMFNKGVILIHGKKDIQGGIRIWEDLLRTHPDFAQKTDLQQKIDQFRGAVR